METTLLFESFMVFYLLEVLFLALTIFWFYKEEPKKQIKIIENNTQTGLSASKAMAMYKMADKLRREQGLR